MRPPGWTGTTMGTSSDAVGTNLLKIGEVCEEFGLTLRTLRFYEARRLVAPKRERTRRYYRKRDIERLRTIMKLRSFGLTLREIRALLRNPGDGPFGLTTDLCEELIGRLSAQRAAAKAALADLRDLELQFQSARRQGVLING